MFKSYRGRRVTLGLASPQPYALLRFMSQSLTTTRFKHSAHKTSFYFCFLSSQIELPTKNIVEDYNVAILTGDSELRNLRINIFQRLFSITVLYHQVTTN